MAAKIIGGADLATSIKNAVASDVVKYKEIYGREPNLVLVLVGDDQASAGYVASKQKAADSLGIRNSVLRLPDTISQLELLNVVRSLNDSKVVDGMLVQLPLPAHINEELVMETISKYKDVDGFHPLNVAGLWQHRDCVPPCTPRGIISLIKTQNINMEGKHVVVMGRSQIVGLPVAKLFLDENASVTVVHSKTNNLVELCQQADILVPAIGCVKFVKKEMIKEGAVIIDVGVNRDETTGKLCGDVDIDDCMEKASIISKVPGGVGLITIAMLMQNTLECYLRNVKDN